MNRLLLNIKRHFKRNYFFFSKKIKEYYYDETTGTYFLDKKDKTRAKDILSCWWNGDNGILNVMILKIEQMFFEIKKNGNHSYNYVMSQSVLGNDKDKNWALSKVLTKMNKTHKKEFITNVDCEESDSGLKHIYLVDEDKMFKVYEKTDEVINPKKIPKNKKLYTIEGLDSTVSPSKIKSVEAPQYKTKNSIMVFECDRLDQAMRFFHIEYNVNLIDKLLLNQQSFEVGVKDYCLISKELKSEIYGQRNTLKELLHLRRLVKNIKRIETFYPWEMKEFNNWDTMTYEEKKDALIVSEKKFLNKRREAYRKVADFMSDLGGQWWD